MTGKKDRPIALYIHIPFCRARCLYCAFPSRPAGHSTQSRYIEEVCREISDFFSLNPDYKVETVYVGGGTPSTLSEGDIQVLTKTINKVAPDAIEISFEANPHIDDLPKIPLLLENGVNRLSIGVQSFDDSELDTIGRLHNADDAREFINTTKLYGCWNFSIDL
ncbi:MAG: radical SAM protein, partial [bacterium]|nr:radical SAM protein [bacterium]